jgi:predicted nucleic acid-binding protein
MMILIDSNIIIYAALGKFPALFEWMAEKIETVALATHNTVDFSWINGLEIIDLLKHEAR